LSAPPLARLLSRVNILIVGMGQVGSHLAKVLSSDHRVTVVDPDGARLRRVVETLDVRSVVGDGSHPEVLDSADASSADLLLAVSNDDNVNMLTCLFGKRMGTKKAVLRVKDLTPFRGFRTFLRRNLAYDLVLSLEDLAAEEIVKVIRQNQAIGVENFADGKIQMRRLRLNDESKLLGTPLKELKIPAGVLIVAIDRAREVIIPGGNDELQAGDEVFVLGEPKGIASLEKRTGLRSIYLRKVVITGASRVVVAVCEALQRFNVDVRVIVADREEARELSAQLEGVVVLHGEGTDVGLLREERVGEADVFLGVSDDDERNLMSCQLSKRLGVPRTLALVQKSDYVDIYHHLGIDVAVSPRLLCANRILSFVRSGSVSTIASIEEGKAEVLEVELPHGSRLVGRTLAEAGFPRGCVVGAIAREDGEIKIPTGTDELRALDNLVVFVLRDVVDDVVKLTVSRS
jgi:trk system potassium uptake protein TrkA